MPHVKSHTRSNLPSTAGENGAIAVYTTKKPKSRFKRFVRNIFILLQLTMLILSAWSIYVTRQNYVFRCSAGGMLMTQAKCDEFSQAKFQSLEIGRLEMVANNADLFGEDEAQLADKQLTIINSHETK